MRLDREVFGKIIITVPERCGRKYIRQRGEEEIDYKDVKRLVRSLSANYSSILPKTMRKALTTSPVSGLIWNQSKSSCMPYAFDPSYFSARNFARDLKEAMRCLKRDHSKSAE